VILVAHRGILLFAQIFLHRHAMFFGGKSHGGSISRRGFLQNRGIGAAMSLQGHIHPFAS
jgi:hypothetical protein